MIITRVSSNYITFIGGAISILKLGLLFFAVTSFGLAWSYNMKTNVDTDSVSLIRINNNYTTEDKKDVILAFDDAWKSQFTFAKPILDKYGFKGSFFIVCNYVGKTPDRMTWDDVQTLEKQGHDIESHSMNHIPLDDLSQQQLNYEIGQSKQCIIDHSIGTNTNNKDISTISNNRSVPIFAYPFDIGHANMTVINTVAKFYQFGRTGDKPLAYLNCDLSLEDKKNGSITQSDYLNGKCENMPPVNTGSNNSKTGFASTASFDNLGMVNKYTIRSWTHHVHHPNISYNSSQMYNQFILEVNSQDKYNVDGRINTIPIITYHNFTNYPITKYSRNEYNTDANLFSREMKYLYNNHFIVLPMSNIRFNEINKDLYLNITK
jgi:hypothetical protein